MLKNILNLDGAQQLSKNDQKEIIGGVPYSCSTSYEAGCLGMTKTTCINNGGEYYMLCKCCW